MTKVTVDSRLGARLNSLAGPIELCDEAGRTLGYFHPAVVAPVSQATPQVRSPRSEDELRRRRLEPGGRPLQDVLADLQQR